MFITCAKRRFDNYYDYSSHQPERYLELEYHSGFWPQPQQQHVPPPELTQDEKATQPGQLLKLGPPSLYFTQICSHLFLQSFFLISSFGLFGTEPMYFHLCPLAVLSFSVWRTWAFCALHGVGEPLCPGRGKFGSAINISGLCSTSTL